MITRLPCIPTGQQDIRQLGLSDAEFNQLKTTTTGDETFSLPIRDVYYLVRGKRNNRQKVCLVHGKFFETIRSIFLGVLEDHIRDVGLSLTGDVKAALTDLFSQPNILTQARSVNDATVNVAFRVEVEPAENLNLLDKAYYPEIVDDSLNFIVPIPNTDTHESHIKYMKHVLSSTEFAKLNIFRIAQDATGEFLVFQQIV